MSNYIFGFYYGPPYSAQFLMFRTIVGYVGLAVILGLIGITILRYGIRRHKLRKIKARRDRSKRKRSIQK